MYDRKKKLFLLFIIFLCLHDLQFSERINKIYFTINHENSFQNNQKRNYFSYFYQHKLFKIVLKENNT